MTENMAKKTGSGVSQAWRWLLWGVRWLAIVVFGLLLCIGVFFALPWKILVCLAVIPLVGIFVPQRIQPWCWGVLTAILLGVAAWLYVPREDSGRWRTYRFDEDLARLLQARRIDGQLNAAGLYDRVLDQYDESIFDLAQSDPAAELHTFTTPWNPKDFKLLTERLELFEPAIPLLIEAAAVDQCRFPIASDLIAVGTQLRRLNQLKGWGRLLIRSANADLQAGALSQALEKQLAVLGMARHLYQQQTLFDHAAGFFLELIAARSLKRYALDYADDPADLDRILSAMAAVQPGWPDAWDGVTEHEKLVAKNITALLYQIDDRGRTRIHRNAITAVGDGMGYSVPRILKQETISRATVLALWLSVPISPENAGRLVDRRFDKYSEQSRRGTPASVLPIRYVWRLGLNPASAVEWLARHQMSYYAALDGQYTSHIAMSRATTVMVELKRYYLEHRRWPRHLSELGPRLGDDTLIDPVSTAPFVYGVTEAGFFLYSLGRNRADDHGQNDPLEHFDDIVFWPLYPPDEGFF